MDYDEHDDDYDEDEPRELVATAASEHGPTTYTQHEYVDPSSTGEAVQMPDVVTYGEAGIHHEDEWTEGKAVTKVVRAEDHDDAHHVSASTKIGRERRR